MPKDRREPEFGRELANLPEDQRWREWMSRIEAVLVPSALPVSQEDLAEVEGQGGGGRFAD